MFEKIKELLITNRLNHEMRINQHPGGCCNEDILITDYDNVVKKFSAALRIEEPASCDCLYFNEQKKELIFIEMRKLQETFTRRKRDYPDAGKFNEFLEDRLNQDRFEN